jgi:hypothetical protein
MTDSGMVRPRLDCRSCMNAKPLRPFQPRLRVDRGGVPCRHHRVEPVLVVDAIPFADAPDARAFLEQIVKARIGRIVEQASVDEFPDQDEHVGLEHGARSPHLGAHVAEPMLAVLLRPSRRRHRLRSLDEAAHGARIPRHRNARVGMEARRQRVPFSQIEAERQSRRTSRIWIWSSAFAHSEEFSTIPFLAIRARRLARCRGGATALLRLTRANAHRAASVEIEPGPPGPVRARNQGIAREEFGRAIRTITPSRQRALPPWRTF